MMAALNASGDRAEALKHASTHAAILRAELDANPDPDVEALAEKLRREPVTRHPADAVRVAIESEFQRFVPEVDAPPLPGLAVPGDYLLFVVSENGLPSEGLKVRL